MGRLWAEEGPRLGLSCDKAGDRQATPVPAEARPQHGRAGGSVWHLRAAVSRLTPPPQTLCSAALTLSPPSVPGRSVTEGSRGGGHGWRWGSRTPGVSPLGGWGRRGTSPHVALACTAACIRGGSLLRTFDELSRGFDAGQGGVLGKVLSGLLNRESPSHPRTFLLALPCVALGGPPRVHCFSPMQLPASLPSGSPPGGGGQTS